MSYFCKLNNPCVVVWLETINSNIIGIKKIYCAYFFLNLCCIQNIAFILIIIGIRGEVDKDKPSKHLVLISIF